MVIGAAAEVAVALPALATEGLDFSGGAFAAFLTPAGTVEGVFTGPRMVVAVILTGGRPATAGGFAAAPAGFGGVLMDVVVRALAAAGVRRVALAALVVVVLAIAV